MADSVVPGHEEVAPDSSPSRGILPPRGRQPRVTSRRVIRSHPCSLGRRRWAAVREWLQGRRARTGPECPTQAVLPVALRAVRLRAGQGRRCGKGKLTESLLVQLLVCFGVRRASHFGRLSLRGERAVAPGASAQPADGPSHVAFCFLPGVESVAQ